MSDADTSIYQTRLGADAQTDEAKKVRREAYDKAHAIRQFEISMYWQRSAYLWTIQAAVLAGLGFAVSEFTLQANCIVSFAVEAPPIPKDSLECVGDHLRMLVIITVWLFGVVSAYVWLLLLKGAKFWQNNWERHVDRLEDEFSGRLYKLYAVDIKNIDLEDPKGPYSVSKLNELMATSTLLIWALIGIMAPLIVSGEQGLAAGLVVNGIMLILSFYFDSCLRMSNFGRIDSQVDPSGHEGEVLLRRSNPSLLAPPPRCLELDSNSIVPTI